MIIEPVPLEVVRKLCERYHGYGSAGGSATYAFAVIENGIPVAAYAWQPPPPGAAKSVSPGCPSGALALSRMIAVPKEQRALKHVSKPLMVQMKRLIDRGRWPVLVTYSDSSVGHTGYVYQCSGWTKTEARKVRYFLDDSGARASSYSNGKHGGRVLRPGGAAIIQRWEHRACVKGAELEHMMRHGWQRVAVPGKTWRSGSPAFTWVKDG